MATLVSTNFQRLTRGGAAPVAPRRYHDHRQEMLLAPRIPGEDVYLHHKRIDNSRLIPRPDPTARRRSWKFIGWTAGSVAVLLVFLLPFLWNLQAGYQLEELRTQIAERSAGVKELQVEKAKLGTPEHMLSLMDKLGMKRPPPWEVHLLNPVTKNPQLARN